VCTSPKATPQSGGGFHLGLPQFFFHTLLLCWRDRLDGYTPLPSIDPQALYLCLNAKARHSGTDPYSPPSVRPSGWVRDPAGRAADGAPAPEPLLQPHPATPPPLRQLQVPRPLALLLQARSPSPTGTRSSPNRTSRPLVPPPQSSQMSQMYQQGPPRRCNPEWSTRQAEKVLRLLINSTIRPMLTPGGGGEASWRHLPEFGFPLKVIPRPA